MRPTSAKKASQATDYRGLIRRYNQYAPQYDRRFARYTAATLEKALEVMPEKGDGLLVDVACGTGVLIDMIRERRPGMRFVGVDLSPDMLEQARQRIPESSVEWTLGQAEVLPVQSGVADVLTCTNAFHLVQDAHTALREFSRVLKPGGTIVLVDWCSDYPQMQLLSALARVKDRQPRKVRRLGDTVALLEEAGFTILESERFVPRALWGMMRLVGKRA